MDGAEDLRALPFTERRKRLEALVSRAKSSRIDLSPLQPFGSWRNWRPCARRRRTAIRKISEGIMLKPPGSIYEAGRQPRSLMVQDGSAILHLTLTRC